MRNRRLWRFGGLLALCFVLIIQPSESEPIQCTFDPKGDATCFEVPPSGSLSWERVSSTGDSDPDLPPGNNGDWYGALTASQSTKAGDHAILRMSLLAKEDNARCLTFSHFHYGTRLPKLELLRDCFSNSTLQDIVGPTVIWAIHGQTTTYKDWTKQSIKLQESGEPLDQCVLSFIGQAYFDGPGHGNIVLDNVISDDCSQSQQDESICNWDVPCQTWTPLQASSTTWSDTTAVQWEIRKASQLPSHHYDTTMRSSEGKVALMRQSDAGCYSARLLYVSATASQRRVSCFSFNARTFTTAAESTMQSAEIFMHIVNTTGDDPVLIDTPWSTRLPVYRDDETWMPIYAYLDTSLIWDKAKNSDVLSSAQLAFMLEARFCTTLDGGIAIDDLRNLVEAGSHCKLPGDEEFDDTTNFFWVPYDLHNLRNNWISQSPDHPGSFLNITSDHTMMESIPHGKALVSENKLTTEISQIQSSAISAPTFSRCVTFWFYGTHHATNQLTVFVKPLRVNGDDHQALTSLDQVWQTVTVEPLEEWIQASFWYSTKTFHRLIFQARGGFAIDDIAFQDGVCGCKPESTLCKHTLNVGGPTVHWFINEMQGYYSRVGKCPLSVPSMLDGMYYDTSLVECERLCTLNPLCKTFIHVEHTHICELKSVNCPNLDLSEVGVDDTVTTVYQRATVPKYFNRPGECADNSPFQTINSVDSPANCATPCEADDSCVAFVYAKLEKKCWLHSQTCAVLKEVPDRETFELVEFDYFLRYAGNCDATGGATVSTSTRRDCAKACSTASCPAFSFEESRSKCTLWADIDCATKPLPVPNTATYLNMAAELFSCDFESDCSSWAPHSDDQNDFALVVTSSVDGYAVDGPSKDTTVGVDGKGSYLMARFLDTSHGIGKATYSLDGYFMPKDMSCLTFRYYMYGPSIGQLKFFYHPEANPTPTEVWVRQGSQREEWLEARVDLLDMPNRGENYSVGFEVYLERDYYGAIAIDDIRVVPGRCLPPPVPMCTLDYIDSCQLIRPFSKWNIYTGQNFQINIPDVNYATPLGRFMASTANDLLSLASGEQAVLRMNHKPTKERCLLFWYRRGTCSVLTVGLTVSNVTQNRELVSSSYSASSFSNDIDVWTKTSYNIPAADSDDATIDFFAEPVQASDCQTDMYYVALDDMVVLEHGCRRKPACNFESRTCAFSSAASTGEKMPWLFGHVPALSQFPAPDLDNTMAIKGFGDFAIVEQVNRAVLTGVAELASYWIRV